MDVLKVIGLCILIIVGGLGVTWIAQGNHFFMYQYFAPQYEGVRRNVFEQSKAYNQGMSQELENMRFQYEQADPGHQSALAAIILHRAADYDESRLTPDMRQFIAGLRQTQYSR